MSIALAGEISVTNMNTEGQLDYLTAKYYIAIWQVMKGCIQTWTSFAGETTFFLLQSNIL